MSVPDLMALLTQEHGLRFDELAEDRLRRALAADHADEDVVARRAIVHPGLRQQLLDAVTLQETSFFRDPAAWEALGADLLPAALRAVRGGPLVVWSAGCANGQEAWGLAMLLCELGASHFEVVATDLSAAAVARTGAGVYGERELRGLAPERRRRFLERDGEGWRVRDELREHVRVVQQNVATGAPPVARGSCALILCRYVLIYIEPPAAHRVLDHVEESLAPEGRLVIGAAESLWHLTERFTPVGAPHAVAYRKRQATDAGHPRAVLRRMRDEPALARPPQPSAGARDAAGLVAAGEAAASRGDLPAAAAAFRGAAYLDPDDAVAHAGLGLVLEALGDPGATRAYRSAASAFARRAPDARDAAFGGYAPTALEELVATKLGRIA